VNHDPFPFQDFARAKKSLFTALVDEEEPYALLTGETGSGKTALLRQVRQELDRTRHRILYFAEAKRLGAPGLVKVVGESLRVRPSMCHAVTFDRLRRTLPEESQRLLLFADEAHRLPEETLDELRALVEGDLDRDSRIQILLAGLPKLRGTLQGRPSLWRRIVVREEICGLLREEVQPFLDHHFEGAAAKRLCEKGLDLLFERSRGAPGLLLPLYRAVLRRAGGTKAKVDPLQVEEILERWDMP
jgi:type II secretory pathway predicted ATPase ExeA